MEMFETCYKKQDNILDTVQYLFFLILIFK
jgi:hypothetical protein